ncbi:MAG: hypothetical protein AAGI37_15405 [Planctomycetota bacterium]
MSINAPKLLFLIAYLSFLAGCCNTSRTEPHERSYFRLYLVERDPKNLVPVVVLSGDRGIIASNDAGWDYYGSKDGNPIFLSGSGLAISSSRYGSPYYYYEPLHSFPDNADHLAGSVNAPIWVGPAISKLQIDQTDVIRLCFSLWSYSSSASTMVINTFNWSIEHGDSDFIAYKIDQ